MCLSHAVISFYMSSPAAAAGDNLAGPNKACMHMHAHVSADKRKKWRRFNLVDATRQSKGLRRECECVCV